jgi:hypothetical protein
MGTDKKILLEKLPSKLDRVITSATCDTVIRLWKVQYFHKVYFYARVSVLQSCAYSQSLGL